jgi:transcription termination factor NusB
MNTSTLDKSTDKIIDRMTPEELAKYVNSRYVYPLQDGRLNEVTEDVEREIDVFIKKHINTLSNADHYEYMKALHRESDKVLMRVIAGIEIKSFQKSITIEEWTINTCCYAIHHILDILPSDEADKQLHHLKEIITGCIKDIQDIEETIDKYIHKDLWTTYGGAPEIPERKSVLLDEMLKSIMM